MFFIYAFVAAELIYTIVQFVEGEKMKKKKFELSDEMAYGDAKISINNSENQAVTLFLNNS